METVSTIPIAGYRVEIAVTARTAVGVRVELRRGSAELRFQGKSVSDIQKWFGALDDLWSDEVAIAKQGAQAIEILFRTGSAPGDVHRLSLQAQTTDEISRRFFDWAERFNRHGFKAGWISPTEPLRDS
jgi:hypothetical protein